MKCPKCHSDNSDSSRFCSSCAALLAPEGQPSISVTKTLETPLQIISKGSLIAGKYRIIEEIGRGGMGVVYKAEDIKLKRSVALKFLPPHLMDSHELKERFIIEAQAAAALSHPNICIIHEVGEAENQSFIAMEYVEGQTLRDKIKKGPLKAEEALDIVTQVAAGLGEAHRKGIIHRDIKSANIMVTDKGQAKVMDFGLAKLRGGSSLTKSQTTLGTVAYMSPEQARGGELDQRTDIWSLGVVLYEMLAGRLPFRGEHDQAVIYSILHQEPESLIKARPDTAPELGHIVGQALAKKADDRYQTMEELCEDLEAVAEGLKPLKARGAKKIFGIRKAYVYSGLAVVLALMLGLNFGGLRNRLLGRSGAPARAVKLAVLPFVNLSGDPEQEYLSDGLTQEMIALLGRLHPQSLGVIARASVMRYKKGDTPVDQIGRELGVDYVLEGSAQREANRVRITVELIHVKDQTQLWADTYEREFSGILTLRSEVVQKVAGALALKLLPSEQAILTSARTVNPEAHEAYLKGFYHWQKMTPQDADTAERYFELALTKDPSYAPAYEGLAIVWSYRQKAGVTPPYEAGPKAKAAAMQAIALDDDSAEAHEALAMVRTWTDWDWAGAEPEWRRALEINPNAANTHAYYAHFLAIMGRTSEAIARSERALELDPFNALYHGMYAKTLYFGRRYDDAIAAARTALAIQPDQEVGRGTLQYARISKRMRDELLADQRERIARDPERVAAFEQGLAEAGYEGAQRRLADLLAARYEKSGGVPDHGILRVYMPCNIALRYLDAGDYDRAIDWLEKAYEVHDPNLVDLGSPLYDPLRSDPRFHDLLRRMGIPEGGKK